MDGRSLNRKCSHEVVEEIANYAGRVIGRQCTTCLVVLSGVGRCAGCGKDGATLRYLVGESRYCDRDCRQLQLKEKREAGK